ncbi:MAG: class I SAM-dependent methyltransferase, partial [Leptolyngbya sp.]|nr:class I SAM-dependent methyltransferase [Candidatus Melainabacteria bacterium]
TAQAANSDVQVLSQDLTKTWQLEDNSINVVFSSNFLEHLPTKDAILHTFKEAHRVLAPGGKIILLGPNIRFCYDVYWDFFDHYIPLSDRSVNEALNLEGFETIKSIDRFLPFSMQNKVPTHPLLVSLYLRMPFAWPYFGKQFLIVANSNKKK